MSRSRHGGWLADKKRTRSSKVLLKIFWSYLQPYKFHLAFVAVLTLVYTLAVTYQPIIVQNAIDRLLGGSTFQSLLFLLVLYMGLSLLSWVFQSLITWYMAIVQNELVHTLRIDTFNKLVDADMSYHGKVQSGNVTSRVVNDTQEITAGLGVFTNSLTNVLVAFATLFVLFDISLWFGLVSLLALPTSAIITKVISGRGRAQMLKVRSSLGKVSGALAENLSGVSIAKSFNQEERTSRQIRKLNDETYGYFKQLGTLFTMIFPSISLIGMIMIAGILYIGGYLNQQGLVSVGSIYLGTVMVRRFLSPIMALANNFTNLQASLAALDRIVDVLHMEASIKALQSMNKLVLTKGEIVFEGVYFKYQAREEMNVSSLKRRPDSLAEEERLKFKDLRKQFLEEKRYYVLENVNITFLGGKKTALIGHTGAGKTTITKLLLRFYDPLEGRILIDGQDLKEVSLDSLYENISLVTQEPYLFAGTIMDNIKYGKPDASDDEVYEICRHLGADEFIEALPNGFQTVLQESGKSLSAGQRQMITIARTMLKNPKILVLDEATSRLDAYSESLVQLAQQKLFEGRTTIVIAHRLSTIRDVDQIVVLDKGKVVEVGDHETLMKLKGKYYELYNTYYAHQGLENIAIAS